MLDLVDFASDKNMQQFCFIPKLGKATIFPAVIFVVVIIIILVVVIVVVFVVDDQPWSHSRGLAKLLGNYSKI